MNAIQKYELIRPILKHEKTPRQVSKEKNIPLVTIYRYLKRFRKCSVLPSDIGTTNEDMESLTDKSHAIHKHPKWFSRKDKDKVVQYKLQHAHLSSRQLAKKLTEENILSISYHSVSDILKEHSLSAPFLPISHLK